MGRIVTITGGSGAGKSTFATNLAVGLAKKDKVVILMQTEMNHGRLQTFFNEFIPSEKGIGQALIDKTESPEKFLVQCKKIHENIYLMGIPSENEDVFMGNIEKDKGELIFRKLSMMSDYLIIDTENDIRNGFSLLGIKKADLIFNIYRADATFAMWDRSMRKVLESLKDYKVTIKNILSLHQLGVIPEAFVSMLGLEIYSYLPNVSEAAVLENKGIPIVEAKGKQEHKYKKVITEIIKEVEGKK